MPRQQATAQIDLNPLLRSEWVYGFWAKERRTQMGKGKHTEGRSLMR